MPAAFVSTGRLPDDEVIARLVSSAYERYRRNREGEVSEVYPALARAHPDLFGICLASVGGDMFSAGDADHEFTIMSVAKPFMFALVCEMFGAEQVRARIGVNATGLPFNSVTAIERAVDGRTNPMVNAGAIATTSLIPGRTPDARWRVIQEGLSRFAGRPLTIDDEVFSSASASNAVNRSLAVLLKSRGGIEGDPADAVDLYTRQSSLSVSARDLAVMAATLADGGVNPLTRTRVVSAETCHYTLAAMSTAGLYETSGDWLFDTGLPGKSGIGGGIVTVSPGKCGLGTFAPPLDRAGNSIKGQFVAKFLSHELGLDLFLSSVTADASGKHSTELRVG